MDSARSGKVVEDYDSKAHKDGEDDNARMEALFSGDEKEDYDNKAHKDGEDENARMEALFLSDEKFQKPALVMEKETGSVVGLVNKVEVNKGCVDDPNRVLEPECDGTVENADRGMTIAKHIIDTSVKDVAPELKKDCIVELDMYRFPEVTAEEETSKDKDVNKPENMELDMYRFPEVTAEEETSKDKDVNKPENMENVKCDNQVLATTKHITKTVKVANAPEVMRNYIDNHRELKVHEIDADEPVNNEDINKFESAENVKKDNQSMATTKLITEERKEADVPESMAKAKLITEETKEADVPEVKEIWRDVRNEHKVCEDSAKVGIVNNEHLDIYEVAEKGHRNDDATYFVDITSLKIDDEGSVDMPPNTVETDIDNEKIGLDKADIKTVTAGDTPYTSATAFEDLNLSAELLSGVYTEMGFQRPSKIQAITLPMILRPPYQNLVAQAHSGSGKTTCFVLGMLCRIDPKLIAPQALCVCPTRELAIQNCEVLNKMGKHTGIGSICAIPSDIGNYVTTSRRAAVNEQVVIGTPGTVKKWISNKVLHTRYLEILVFDEADQMLAQDGFQDDSMRIMRDIKKNRDSCQILLFSATFNDNVKMFITRMIPNANQVFVKKEDLSLDAIKQYCVKCPNEVAKFEVLKDRIFPLSEKLGQTIIFVRTRESASRLHSMLEADGHKCTSIHGHLKLEDRDRIIGEFRSGITRILISTDVIARGFDQAQVTLVVNFDLPVRVYPTDEPDYEVYLHRIGRSGRFGRKGAVFNFIVTTQDEEKMTKIERHFQRHAIEVRWDNEADFESALKDAGLA